MLLRLATRHLGTARFPIHWASFEAVARTRDRGRSAFRLERIGIVLPQLLQRLHRGALRHLLRGNVDPSLFQILQERSQALRRDIRCELGHFILECRQAGTLTE